MAFVIVVVAVIYFIKWYRKPKLAIDPFDSEYNRYIENLGDKNFICYNNRNKLKEFVEANILPYLPPEIEVIYLNGKEPVSDYPQTVISTLLYKSKDYDGFPHLVKLRDGEQVETSINNETYNCIEQGKPVEPVLWKIYEFFEVAGKVKNVEV